MIQALEPYCIQPNEINNDGTRTKKITSLIYPPHTVLEVNAAPSNLLTLLRLDTASNFLTFLTYLLQGAKAATYLPTLLRHFVLQPRPTYVFMCTTRQRPVAMRPLLFSVRRCLILTLEGSLLFCNCYRSQVGGYIAQHNLRQKGEEQKRHKQAAGLWLAEQI